jgi:hypothetical protein
MRSSEIQPFSHTNNNLLGADRMTGLLIDGFQEAIRFSIMSLSRGKKPLVGPQ